MSGDGGELYWAEDVVWLPRMMGEPQKFYVAGWQMRNRTGCSNTHVAWVHRIKRGHYELRFYNDMAETKVFRSAKQAKAYAMAITKLT